MVQEQSDPVEGQNGAIVAVSAVKASLASIPTAATVETHTQKLGLIVPPPDIRAIADKTAQFVSKNGEYGIEFV
jgi:hypothetical protein